MRISSLFLLFSVQITLANSALTELVYDSSKTYSKGDARIPSVTEFTFTLRKLVYPLGKMVRSIPLIGKLQRITRQNCKTLTLVQL